MELEEEVVLLVLLHKTLQKKKRKHKFWIHSLLNSRQERGVFYTAFNDFRNNDSKFLTYWRMSVGSFEELFQHIVSDTSGSDNKHEKMCSSRRAAGCNLAVGLTL
jgi:hypothetical protein